MPKSADAVVLQVFSLYGILRRVRYLAEHECPGSVLDQAVLKFRETEYNFAFVIVHTEVNLDWQKGRTLDWQKERTWQRWVDDGNDLRLTLFLEMCKPSTTLVVQTHTWQRYIDGGMLCIGPSHLLKLASAWV